MKPGSSSPHTMTNQSIAGIWITFSRRNTSRSTMESRFSSWKLTLITTRRFFYRHVKLALLSQLVKFTRTNLLLAVANPHHEVYLIFAKKVGFFNDSGIPVIDALMSYGNIHMSYTNIYEYAENTPLEDWMRHGALLNSTFLLTHTSDILRFLTLWRYTGTYIDLDMIVRVPLEPLGINFACAQRDKYVNSAFMNLGADGRKIAESFFEHTVKGFNPKLFINNGPLVLTKIIRQMCNTSEPPNPLK
jgi:hypothetical protein